MSKDTHQFYALRSAAVLLAGLVAFAPILASAAGLSFSTPAQDVRVDDVFIVKLRVSSPDQSINALEGYLTFNKENLEVQEVSVGGSIFSVWAQRPTFSNENGLIRFIGGTPDGFRGEEGDIVSIAFLAKQEGEAQLDFQDHTLLFLHDGEGTVASLRLKPLTLRIAERTEVAPRDEWGDVIATDTTPPEPFEIHLGKDPSIFDGRYFIGFVAVDAESGIAYYEVQEGEGDFVRAESPYVLKDQSLSSIIRVKAVDHAGNERIEELVPSALPAPLYKNVLFWIVVLVIVVAIILVYVYRRKMRLKITS